MNALLHRREREAVMLPDGVYPRIAVDNSQALAFATALKR